MYNVSGSAKFVSRFILPVFLFIFLFAPCAFSQNSGTGGTGFPLNLNDDTGYTLRLKAPPTKIVSLAPSVTEIVYALGMGSSLVGRVDASDFPPESSKVPVIATFGSVNLEAIHAYAADLLIDEKLFSPDVLSTVRRSGIPAVSFDPTNTIAGALAAIEKIGLVLGKSKEARALTASIQSRIDKVRSLVAGKARPRVYYVIGFGEGGDWTGGAGTFVDELIRNAGGTNVASNLQGWQISRETLAASDPDVIILPGSWAKASDFTALPFYRDLRASRTSHVYAIDNNLVERPGPRLGMGLEALARVIHPELFKD